MSDTWQWQWQCSSCPPVNQAASQPACQPLLSKLSCQDNLSLVLAAKADNQPVLLLLPLSAAAFQSSACHVAVEATACGCQLCDTAPWHSGEHFGCQQTHLDFCLCPLLQPICLSVSVCVLLIFGCVVV